MPTLMIKNIPEDPYIQLKRYAGDQFKIVEDWDDIPFRDALDEIAGKIEKAYQKLGSDAY
jgi:MinD-like ATPase involved in chromosome partitioning or flagellar assembly